MTRSAPAFVLLLLAVACQMETLGTGGRPHREESPPATAPADPSGGRLVSRPHPPAVPPDGAGLHDIGTDAGRPTLLYVPPGYRPDRAAPLLVLLHGAGGDARGGIDPLLTLADDADVLLLAPASRAATWDVIVDSFGPDVAAIDRALAYVFDHYSVDPARLGIGGFSDGASYALSVGMTNGDLFTHIVAFSPGFAAPGRTVGRPAVFISHGVDDGVLPIDRTSRRLVPRLRDAGYDVVYEEFPGGHVVPSDHARRALSWVLE